MAHLLRTLSMALAAAILFAGSGCGDTAVPAPPPGGYAAAGEEAFYDTLNGVEIRDQQAIDWLREATRSDPLVGRPWFLLGMMHLWRVAQAWTDPLHASPFVREEVTLAREALARAVVLVPEDTRIPGFHAAARYNEGVAKEDPEITADGLRVLREAMDVNFLFNSFDFVGVVPPTVSGDDPLMAESIRYIEHGLTLLDDCTPKICAMTALVGGTVDSHSTPITAENR